MIFELFLLSTWPFWLLLLLFLGWETFLIEEESAWLATISLITFIVVMALFTDWHPFLWVKNHLEGVIAGCIIYLFLGVAYVYPRWMVYVTDQAKAFETSYKALKEQWDGGSTKWGSGWSQYKTFGEMLRANYKMPPMPWDYNIKGKIYMWMAYWPISATWLLIHRPVEWFYDWAYAYIKDTLVSLSYKMFNSHFES